MITDPKKKICSINSIRGNVLLLCVVKEIKKFIPAACTTYDLLKKNPIWSIYLMSVSYTHLVVNKPP